MGFATGGTNTLPDLLPIVVLICDAWHTPVHYSTFIDSMSSLGYPIACPQLLTANTESNCTSGFHDDCSMIYQLGFDLCSDGNDVLILAHGYGAFVASEILGELGKDERRCAGKTGGVIGLIVVAGLLPKDGETLLDCFGGTWPEYIRQQKRTISLLQPDSFLYNTLGPMDAEHWASHLIRFTAPVHDIVLSARPPAYKSIPTTYVVCEEDAFIAETLQRDMADAAGASIELLEDAGHDAFLGKVSEIVDIVGGVTGKLYGIEPAEEEGSGTDAAEGVEEDRGSNASAPSELEAQRGEEQDIGVGKPMRRSTTR